MLTESNMAKKGWSSLHWAVWNHDSLLVSQLVQDINLLNEQTIMAVEMEGVIINEDHATKSNPWLVKSGYNHQDDTRIPNNSVTTDTMKISCEVNDKQQKSVILPDKNQLVSLEKKLCLLINSLETSQVQVSDPAQLESKSLHENEEKFLTPIPKGTTAIQLAIIVKNLDALKKLFTTGADWKLENSFSHTALHTAAKLDLPKILEYLFSEGVDINTKNTNGDTALHTAILYGSDMAASYLIENGADISSVNTYKKLALHIAIQTSNMNILKKVLEIMKFQGTNFAGTHNPNVVDPLRYAIVNNNAECVQVLLDYGFSTDEQDSSKELLLNLSTQLGLEEVVILLLKHGLDVNKISDKSKKSALKIAIDKHYIRIVHHLLSAGAQLERSLPISVANAHGLILGCENMINSHIIVEQIMELGFKFPQTIYDNNKKQKDGTRQDEIVGYNLISNIIKQFQREPMSLSRLTANCIAQNIKPNAWVGVQQLPFPNILKRYVVQHILH